MALQKGNTLVLSRKGKVWICSECKKEYVIPPPQCTCGATDKVFLEKDIPILETGRKTYTVNGNFIYSAEHIIKGSIVSLIADDKITRDLIKRGLITELQEPKKSKEETSI